MESRIDTEIPDSDPSFADIDPKIAKMLSELTEKEIRMMAKANGIILTSRAGNKKALLVELAKGLRAKRRK